MSTLSFEDGKYVVVSEGGNCYATRYGEKWRDMTGDKLIGCMVSRIEELQAEMSKLEADYTDQVLRAMKAEEALGKAEKQDRGIRRLLCVAVADRPYMDDGEASDQDIDYLRASAEDIGAALQARNMKKLAAGAKHG